MNEKYKKIECSASDGKIFIPIEKIIAIEAAGNHAYIYRSDSEKLFVSNSLKDLNNRLHTSGFCRVHRQYLVNTSRIYKYHQADGGFVEMEDGKKYPISKSGKMLLWEMMKEIVL